MLFPFTACLSRSRRRCSTIAASHPCCIKLGSYLVTYLTCTTPYLFTTLHLWLWTGRVRGPLHVPTRLWGVTCSFAPLRGAHKLLPIHTFSMGRPCNKTDGWVLLSQSVDCRSNGIILIESKQTCLCVCAMLTVPLYPLDILSLK